MDKQHFKISKESLDGQEFVVLKLDTPDKEYKLFFTREQAVGVAQAILAKAWDCRFAIEKEDEQEEAEK